MTSRDHIYYGRSRSRINALQCFGFAPGTYVSVSESVCKINTLNACSGHRLHVSADAAHCCNAHTPWCSAV